MGNILIISFNRFPDGDAGSVRGYTFGKILNSIGHDVTFIGMGDTPCYQINMYEGFAYTSLRIRHSHKNILNKLLNYFGFKERLRRFILQFDSKKVINTIFMTELPLNAMLFLKSFSKKKDIDLIFDSVEWYSPEQFKLYRLDPEYLLNNVSNRFIIDKNFKVIAISKFLENHFKSKKIETVHIPAIIDVQKFSPTKITQKNILTIMYAGSPGKKDYLKDMIEGMSLLSHNELSRVRLVIIGITIEQLRKELKVNEDLLEKVKDNIKVLGWVSREIVLEHLKYADFTILLRSPMQRYAKAGFPTKIVESLASSTPVMVNITSDLGDYIKDMEQGVVVENCSPTSFAHSLRRALSLTYEQRQKMYIKARKCAEECFDYSKYKEVLAKIL